MTATSLVNPQTLNLFAYCANDPINHTDPSGLGFFSKLWHAIKKVLSNKWVMIALSVALTVIAVGAALHLINLTKVLQVAAGASGYFDAAGNSIPILMTVGHVATTLGWVSSGLQAALAVTSISFSAKKILANTLLYAAGIGISQVLSRIPIGTVGPGGTPGFNPNAGFGFDGKFGGLTGGVSGRPGNVCLGEQTWEYRYEDMRQIAAAVGGTFNKFKSTIQDTGSYNEVLARLKGKGFSRFVNLNPEHFGGTDFEGRVNGSWYHVTVGYPSGLPPFNHVKRPPWITVHCESGGQPSSPFHVFR